jgi:hypothetical protein
MDLPTWIGSRTVLQAFRASSLRHSFVILISAFDIPLPGPSESRKVNE